MLGVLVAATTLACHASLPHAPRVPAPVVLHTSCANFALSTDGELSRLVHHTPASNRTVSWRNWGTPLIVRRNRAGRIFVLRHHRLVWRSHDLYPNDGGSIAFGPHAFAFASYVRGVFLTNLDGPERLVVRGRGLYPYAFNNAGQLIVGTGRTIALLSRTGATLRRYHYRLRNGFAFDERTDTLFFVTPNGTLARANGTRLRLVRPLPDVDGMISVEQPGQLIFGGGHEIAVTRRDGALIARANWARSRRVVSDSGVSVARDRKAFAFRLTDAHPGSRSSRATVYVLRAGASNAQAIYRHHLGPSGCAVGAGLSWHGPFLLYTSTDGRSVVLDTTSGHAVDLTRVARLLPRRSVGELARVLWRSDFESEY
jgi:hypothetical protein